MTGSCKSRFSNSPTFPPSFRNVWSRCFILIFLSLVLRWLPQDWWQTKQGTTSLRFTWPAVLLFWFLLHWFSSTGESLESLQWRQEKWKTRKQSVLLQEPMWQPITSLPSELIKKYSHYWHLRHTRAVKFRRTNLFHQIQESLQSKSLSSFIVKLKSLVAFEIEGLLCKENSIWSVCLERDLISWTKALIRGASDQKRSDDLTRRCEALKLSLYLQGKKL